MFAQQVARAFLEHGNLKCFATTFAFRDNSGLSRLLSTLPRPLASPIIREFGRRRILEVPEHCVATSSGWELIRSALAKAGASPPIVDRAWDAMAHRFTRHVARTFVPGSEALYAYEYTALEAFAVAKAKGVASVLDLPSLSSREFEALQAREREQFPDLSTRHDDYFARAFPRRQRRRDREIELADVIVANSSLTARSHIENGADRSKIVVVPYGAPPAIGAMEAQLDTAGPMRVIWAGTFSVRKGAHYFLEAWRRVSPSHATAQVFGAVTLPKRLLHPSPAGIEFCGSKPQSDLFAAFRRADVLIFPTLSDGFGMVVTEAFANGLPVIATDRAGAADLIEHGKNGLIVAAGSASAIEEALRWCLDNRQRLFEMRTAALETAKQWQWADYRRALIAALGDGLRRAGYTPAFGKGPAPLR